MTYKTQYNKKYKFPQDQTHSLADMAKTTGFKRSVLQDVYNRGIGAWKSNPSSVRLKSGKKSATAPRSRKMGKEQWATARVYSFLMGGKARQSDLDLWKKRKG